MPFSAILCAFTENFSYCSARTMPLMLSENIFDMNCLVLFRDSNVLSKNLASLFVYPEWFVSNVLGIKVGLKQNFIAQ